MNQYKQALIASLMGGGQPVRHWAQGAANMANTLAGALMMKREEEKQRAGLANARKALTPIFNPPSQMQQISVPVNRPDTNLIPGAMRTMEIEQPEQLGPQQFLAAALNEDVQQFMPGVANALMGRALQTQAPLSGKDRYIKTDAGLWDAVSQSLVPGTAGASSSQYDQYVRAKRAGDIPRNMSFDVFRSSGTPSTTVNVGNGQKDDLWGPPDSGFVWARDKAGQVVTEQTEDGYFRPVQVPIAGGKTDTERTAAEEAATTKKAGKDVQLDVITEDIDRALSNIDSGIDLPVLGNSQTGVSGTLLGAVPGTSQHSLGKLLDTIKANVGFEKLQQMREASPTGGALGSVSERENTLLQSVLGSLEQSNSSDDLRFNLMRLREVLVNIIHGPPEHRNQAQFGAPNADASVDDLVNQYAD